MASNRTSRWWNHDRLQTCRLNERDCLSRNVGLDSTVDEQDRGVEKQGEHQHFVQSQMIGMTNLQMFRIHVT
jgi:hypothetical protein